MKRTFAGVALLLVAVAAAAQQGLLDQARDAASGSLAGMLESQLGVTGDQAEGGIGSVLSLAQSRLDAGDFDKLAQTVPGAEGYLEKAQQLGAVAEPLTSMADLDAALGRLGLSPETIEQFVPMVTELMGRAGGPEVQRLLANALSGA